MKTNLLYACCLLSAGLCAQTYSPVAVTGFNFDAIAETSPASASTTNAIDGSDYVLYSAAYGTVFSTGKGLPNSGLVTSGTRSYQMAAYSGNNTSYITAGMKDSLTLVTPASYASLSLLGFATEGNGGMNVTVRFSDGTNQQFTGLTMPDWFNNPNAIISGIDRTGRATNTPNNQSTNPRIYAVDLVLSCANRSKLVSKIVIQNTLTNPRLCVFAVSATALPSYSVSAVDACFGMTNGKATVITTGGLPAFTYTWTSSPVQNTVTATNLPPGSYTATVSDAAGCTNTVAGTVSQPTAALTTTIAASSASICAGKSSTLTASGASTYTWSNSSSGASIVVTPTASGTYSVAGTTAAGCPITGSVALTVNALPVITFSLAQASLCTNSSAVSLNATPAGGVYAGTGVTGSTFSPATAGVGTYTIAYSYTNTAGCAATSVISTTVNPIPVVTFSLTQTQFCPNSDVLFLQGTPASGIFSGTGVTGTVFTPSQAGIGTHTVTYSYTNTFNCTNSASSIATVSACTGLEEIEQVLQGIYPNPGKGVFTIRSAVDLKLTIRNLSGAILKNVEISAGDNSIDLSTLPAGVYVISGSHGQQLVTKKVVIME